jgi:hypothetical protein
MDRVDMSLPARSVSAKASRLQKAHGEAKASPGQFKVEKIRKGGN